jgi:hypothetical protein
VLHIVETVEAATITASIDNESFVVSEDVPIDARVTVLVFNSDSGILAYEEYTQIDVPKSDTDPTAFSVFLACSK